MPGSDLNLFLEVDSVAFPLAEHPSSPQAACVYWLGSKHTTYHVWTNAHVGVKFKQALASQLPLKIAEFKNWNRLFITFY